MILNYLDQVFLNMPDQLKNFIINLLKFKFQMSVIFHVGLPKTASTFLQRRVFPYIEDIEYISSNTSVSEFVFKIIFFEINFSLSFL